MGGSRHRVFAISKTTRKLCQIFLSYIHSFRYTPYVLISWLQASRITLSRFSVLRQFSSASVLSTLRLHSGPASRLMLSLLLSLRTPYPLTILTLMCLLPLPLLSSLPTSSFLTSLQALRPMKSATFLVGRRTLPELRGSPSSRPSLSLSASAATSTSRRCVHCDV